MILNALGYRRFILPNSLAAVSVMTKNETTYATDGIECRIHVFDENGVRCGCVDTLRPYRRLRSNGSCQNMTALGCCNQARLYFLDENFSEIGYVELEKSCNGETDCGCGCGCNCSVNRESFSVSPNEFTDASLTRIGNEEYIVGVTPKNACLFDTCGRRVAKICQAECGEIITDFINPRNDFFAMITQNGKIRTVTVSKDGIEQSAILVNGYTLRMLVPC